MAYATSTYLAIMAGVAAVSALASAGGTAIGAEQQRKASSYNADVAEQDALAAKDKAEADEQAHRENVRRILASQRALYGASGVDMAGTPLLVMESTAEQGELDALTIRYGGDVAAAKERSAANLYKMQGRNAMTSGAINAGTTLLAGAGNVAGIYAKGKK